MKLPIWACILVLACILAVGCRAVPGAGNAAEGPVDGPDIPQIAGNSAAAGGTLCLVDSRQHECPVRLSPALADLAVGLQMDLRWPAEGLSLESVDAGPGIAVMSRPSLPVSTGGARLVLYRTGEPRPLSDDGGVGARLAFSFRTKVSKPIPVEVDGIVATDAAAARILVTLDGDYRLEVAP